MSNMKICSKCNKKIKFNEDCICTIRKNRNKYQRKYYEKNKEALRPLSTKRWRDLRKVIINRDGGYCQRCFIKYDIIETKNLQVHHIKPRIEYPELMFEETNLICICKTCNLQLGVDEELDFKPNEKIFDVDFDFKL